MKQYVFLFNNLQMIYIVEALVLLNTLLGVWISLREKNFSWSHSTDFVRVMLIYLIYMVMGNMLDYVTSLKGLELTFIGLDLGGFKVVSAALIAAQSGKAVYKLQKLLPEDSKISFLKAKDAEKPQ